MTTVSTMTTSAAAAISTMTTSATAVSRTATTSAAKAQTTSAARTASASEGKDGIRQQERRQRQRFNENASLHVK